MKLSLWLAVIVALLTIIFTGQYASPYAFSDESLLLEASQAANRLPDTLTNNRVQNGEVSVTSTGYVLTEDAINLHLAKSSLNERSFIISWQDGRGKLATLSSLGQDHNHHFANSYLVGIHPFHVENDWLPLYVLAQRKIYQLDKAQYGLSEVWQNSAQAYKLLRGDCEDHAMVLADWLISEGVDARVAIGTYKGEGHAWVIAFKQEQTFILEATDKRSQKSWTHYPLAKLAVGYRANFMFNRDTFWQFEDGKSGARQYTGPGWRVLSRYKPYRPHTQFHPSKNNLSGD